MSNGTIKIVCSWCKRHMREENGRGVEGISHSICTDCLNDLRTMSRNGSSSVVKQYQERSSSKRVRAAST
jgi:transposase-like protein